MCKSKYIIALIWTICCTFYGCSNTDISSNSDTYSNSEENISTTSSTITDVNDVISSDLTTETVTSKVEVTDAVETTTTVSYTSTNETTSTFTTTTIITEEESIGNTDESTAVDTNSNEIITADNLFKIVKFGNYGGENIEWYMLDESENNVLLLSKYIIDYKPFNDDGHVIAKDTDWENSSLRSWLNNEFIDEAFTNQEQAYLICTNVQDYKSDQKLGNIVEDRVFLFSREQLLYYTSKPLNMATLTEYASNRSKYTSEYWWLLDSYCNDLYKYNVTPDGFVKGGPRVNEDNGVRPAVWISSDYFNDL